VSVAPATSEPIPFESAGLWKLAWGAEGLVFEPIQ
jgi:hypothetical protein